jgi:membrane-associated phospholipid phosphatase
MAEVAPKEQRDNVHPARHEWRGARDLESAGGDVAERVERERVPHSLTMRRGRLWLTVYMVGLLAAIGLAFAAHAFRLLPGDLRLEREFQENSNPVLFGLMYGVSYIGYPLASGIILAGIAALLWLLRLRVEAGFLVLTLLADGVGLLIKDVVGRHRPLSSLVHVVTPLAGPSFPSGHTVHYTVFYGFLLFVLIVNYRASAGRNALIALCAMLIILVGFSRVYLGEHWPTDVLGGYLIGALCLVPLIYAYLRVKRRNAGRQQYAM